MGVLFAEISKIVLSATVVPVPPEAHYSQLYNAVAELTNRRCLSRFFQQTVSKILFLSVRLGSRLVGGFLCAVMS